MAEEKRRAKMMEKMKEREETLKHMQNYGMGGDGGLHSPAPLQGPPALSFSNAR
jgi:hypothetical protein